MKRSLLAALLLAPHLGAAQTPSHQCYRGRPLPACSSFWISEFGLLGPLPNRYFPYGEVLRWQLGGMSNQGPRTALGAAFAFELDGFGSRYGLMPRYRRWLGQRAALDLSAGVLLHGSDGFRFPGFVAEAGVTQSDVIGAVIQVETLRLEGRRQVNWYGGLKFGSALGVVAGLVLPLWIIASSIPET
jgi:hypothetical protein